MIYIIDEYVAIKTDYLLMTGDIMYVIYLNLDNVTVLL